MAAKRYPLPKRFNAALSEAAYDQLRTLNGRYGYGNNYLLTIILENFDAITDRSDVDRVFGEFEAEFGAPGGGSMSRKS